MMQWRILTMILKCRETSLLFSDVLLQVSWPLENVAESGPFVKGNFIFRPSIFRGYACPFRGGYPFRKRKLISVWGDFVLNHLGVCCNRFVNLFLSGNFLTTNGGLGEALNVGFFALKPHTLLLEAG